MSTPRNMDDLRAIEDDTERALAVGPYIRRAEEAIKDARKVRRDAIAKLLKTEDYRKEPTKLSRAVGVSVSTVKNIRDGRA